jgi:hypothetical protein
MKCPKISQKILLEVLDEVLDDFLVVVQRVSERVEDVPAIVFHDVAIVILSRFIFAISLDQNVLIELDEPTSELLQDRR